VQRAIDQMKTAKFTKLERRVGHTASRRAHWQLMQVPWVRFHRAYEEYIRWQAFVLWARAVVESEGCAPSWLKAILRKRCPGFAEEAARSNMPELMGLQLLPWVHNQVFEFAVEEGWFDALVFYAFRDARSQGDWAYWERSESEWKKRRPTFFPTFAEWRRSAVNWKLEGGARCATVSKSVEKYLDFEAVVYWLRPLFQASKIQLPTHVALDSEQECPGLLEYVNTHISAAYAERSRSWQRLFNWGRDHVLSHAKEEGWLDVVLSHARIHPRHRRIVEYGALCCKSRPGNTALPYPSLGQWRRDAERYVRVSGM
jgi:hypothetical protein